MLYSRVGVGTNNPLPSTLNTYFLKACNELLRMPCIIVDKQLLIYADVKFSFYVALGNMLC